LSRAILTALVLTIPALAQIGPDVQSRITAQQNLIRELRGELAQYTPAHPKVNRLRTLIGVLEDESRLLEQPRESWPQETVQKQIDAIARQLESLQGSTADYARSHPNMKRNGAITDLLESELRSLRER
jgi:hypothetical protein